MSLRDLFRRHAGPSPEELAAAERERRIQEKVAKQVREHPLFRVYTVDGLGWVDPYSGQIIETPFDAEDTVERWLLKHRPWKRKGAKPLDIKELVAIRWRHYLKQEMPEESRLRHFDRQGAWLDPFTGQWVPKVRMGSKVDLDTLQTMAAHLADQPQERLGRLMDTYELEDLLEKRSQRRGQDPGGIFAQSSDTDAAAPATSEGEEQNNKVDQAEPMTPARRRELRAEAKARRAPGLGEGQVLAGFRITGSLGSGGMGTVYRARQVALEREVALKVMAVDADGDSLFVRRFLREARAAAAINHPRVVACYDAGQEGDLLYMALEFVQGGDYAGLSNTQPKGRLDRKTVLAMISDVAEGLTAIDEAGLVHRDIKPDNLFYDKWGRAKIGDLGLIADYDERITLAGKVVGTPAYMSPEQVQGGDLDVRSDIYALGATAYALLTGKPPFVRSTVYAVIHEVVNELPEPLSELRPDLDEPLVELIERMMAKKREDRFKDAETLVAACRELMG